MAPEAASPADDAARLEERVIRGGYCIGCGACAALPGSPFRIALDVRGRLQARRERSGGCDGACAVCPFSGEGPDADALARELFPGAAEHPVIGRHLALHAGWVTDPALRAAGASGGLATWILCALLEEGEVDAVAHVRPSASGSALALEYRLSRTPGEVRLGAGSHYYPVEMSGVLAEIRRVPGRYAVAGVPSFVTAVRLLMRRDPVLRERIVVCVGLVAGHMKSARLAEMLAWQHGRAGPVEAVRFRHKIPGLPANRYGYEVDAGGVTSAGRWERAFAVGDWGLKLFEYPAAEFSDDVLAETADVSVGDAWLPRYVRDGRGASLVIVRGPLIASLLRRGAEDGRLRLEDLTPEDVVRSQRAGLRHAREGFARRAASKEAAGLWHPPLRPRFRKPVDPRYAAVIDARSRISERSDEAFDVARSTGDFGTFRALMEPSVAAYYALWPLWKRAAKRIRDAWRGLR